MRDVQWTLRQGATSIEIRGNGLYPSAAPIHDQQRLVLNLDFDGVPIWTLDSGIVASALSFPEIQIQALTPDTLFQEGTLLSAITVPEPSVGTLLPIGMLGLAAFGGQKI